MSNQPSPLIPQGQLLDPKNKGRARVKLVVSIVLAVHGIGLMALLMQGCRREEPVEPPVPEVETNAFMVPSLEDTNTAPVDANYAPSYAETNVAPPESLPAPVITDNTGYVPPAQTPPAPVTPETPAGAAEYKVAKGDTFYTIAKKFNTSSKAIAEANPNVNPSRLQIGQSLRIPAPSAAAPATVAPAAESTASGGQVYTVKSGDTLTRIASRQGVSVRAIRSANNLTTDRITVGQKLKIPAKGQ